MSSWLDATGIGSIADLAKDALDKIFPDPAARAAAQLALENAKNAGVFKEMDQNFQRDMEQIKANAAEAAQPGFHFRDGAGWMCVAAMASNFIVRPFAIWISNVAGHPVDFPQLDQGVLVQMLFALLGLGYMHMNENVKGTK